METATITSRDMKARPLWLATKGVLWLGGCVLFGLVAQQFDSEGLLELVWLIALLAGTPSVILLHYFPLWQRLLRPVPQGVIIDDLRTTSDLVCFDCGYDLRAISSDRCPECGSEIDRTGVRVSYLPWAHRGQLGRWRAYWRTVRLATFHPHRLAEEIVSPVDEKPARQFATVTAAVAAVPLAAIVLGLMLGFGPNVANPLQAKPWYSVITGTWSDDLALPFAAGVTMLPVIPLGLLLAGWLISHSGALWFELVGARDERARRTASLGFYAAGPLAWVFPAAFFGGGAIVLSVTGGIAYDGPFAPVALAFLGITIFLTAFFIYWLGAVLLFRRAVRPSGAKTLFVAIALPVSWLISLGIALGVMPWTIGLLWLMYDSLRA